MKAVVLLVMALAQGHPLEPQYPFTSCKITYKRFKYGGLDVDTALYIKGAKTMLIKSYSDKSKSIVLLDGTYIYRLEVNADGKVARAQRSYDPGHLLRGDYAQLSDKERKVFADGLQKLWRRWSPAFGLNRVTDAVEPRTVKTERIAGKLCDVFEYREKDNPIAPKYWRWRNTNIVLRNGMQAEKVEENADVPDAVFELPKVEAWNDEDLEVTKATAKAIFKMLTGKDAQAEPETAAAPQDRPIPEPKPQPEEPQEPPVDIKVKLESKEFDFKGLAVQVSLGDKPMLEFFSSDMPAVNGLIWLTSEQKVEDLVGKEFALGAPSEDNASYVVFYVADSLQYESRKATFKVVSVQDGIATIDISGQFAKVEGEKERKVAFDRLTFRARAKK